MRFGQPELKLEARDKVVAFGTGGGGLLFRDRQEYNRGNGMGAFAAPWSAAQHGLVEGVDYADTIRIFPDRFPAGTVIDARWPQHYPTLSGVWGYMHLWWGNADGSGPNGVTPWQVGNIVSGDERVDFDILSASPNNGNVLADLYLTSVAGDPDAKLFEIGVLHHAPPKDSDFVRNAAPIGLYTDPASRVWLVADTGLNPVGAPFIVFMLQSGSQARGRIYKRDMLRYLMQQRILTGSEWLNGRALGVEPNFGVSQTLIREWGGWSAGGLAIDVPAFHGAVAIPSLLDNPRIEGEVDTGAVVTCDPGAWLSVPTSFAYQWKRNGTNIGGATAKTYTIVSGDRGTTLSCQVTATNGQGSAAPITATLAIPTIAPVNILPNGRFNGNSSTGWAGLGYAGKGVSNNRLNFVGTPVNENTLATGLSLTAGATYKVSYDIVVTAGGVALRFTGGSNVAIAFPSTSGHFEHTVVAASGNNAFEIIVGDGPATMSIDNIFIELVSMPNRVSNGDFAAGETIWTGWDGGSKRVVGGKATFTAAAAYDGIAQPIVFVAGKYYEISWTQATTAGSVFARLVGTSNRNGAAVAVNGPVAPFRLLANTGNNQFQIDPLDDGFTGTIDDVVVRGPYNTATVGGA